MIKHGKFIAFTEGFEEVSGIICDFLKIYKVKEAAVYKNTEGKVELSIAGKFPASLNSFISLEPGESISDYEGIDDTTKKTGYVFPLEKCNKLIKSALDFNGRFIEILSEEQDPISGEVKKELVYLDKDTISENKGSEVCEIIESIKEFICKGDSLEDVSDFLFEQLGNIAFIEGNKQLQEECNMKILELV